MPAWTLKFWQAWLFMAVFLTSVNVIGLYLALKDPALLERRKKLGPAQEQSPTSISPMPASVMQSIGA